MANRKRRRRPRRVVQQGPAARAARDELADDLLMISAAAMAHRVLDTRMTRDAAALREGGEPIRERLEQYVTSGRAYLGYMRTYEALLAASVHALRDDMQASDPDALKDVDEHLVALRQGIADAGDDIDRCARDLDDHRWAA